MGNGKHDVYRMFSIFQDQILHFALRNGNNALSKEEAEEEWKFFEVTSK